jgi:hypothetical protein
MRKVWFIRLPRFWGKVARVVTRTLPPKHNMLFEEVGRRESSVSTRRFNGVFSRFGSVSYLFYLRSSIEVSKYLSWLFRETVSSAGASNLSKKVDIVQLVLSKMTGLKHRTFLSTLCDSRTCPLCPQRALQTKAIYHCKRPCT